jgi:histone H1/5
MRPSTSPQNTADLYASSRQAIQKYIKANNQLGDVSDNMFKSHVNRSIQKGEKDGDFTRPKGKSWLLPNPAPFCLHLRPRVMPLTRRSWYSLSNMFAHYLLGASGPVKLAKKETAAAAKKEKAEPKVEKKAAAPKAKKATTTVSIVSYFLSSVIDML